MPLQSCCGFSRSQLSGASDGTDILSRSEAPHGTQDYTQLSVQHNNCVCAVVARLTYQALTIPYDTELEIYLKCYAQFVSQLTTTSPQDQIREQ